VIRVGGALRAIWIWGPLVAYCALIFYLSSLPQVPWASEYPDYLEHALEYLGLSIVTARALNGGLRSPLSTRTLALALALCVGYAILDEIHQKFVPNRLADVTDVLSDAVGAGVGLAGLRFGRRFLVRGEAT
jgi:VanZ family protein